MAVKRIALDMREDPIDRHVIRLPELVGIQHLTALSAHRVIGLDGAFYTVRWVTTNHGYDVDEGPINRSELLLVAMTEDELSVLEMGVVINRLDLVVEFREGFDVPLVDPFYYALDEQSGNVLVALGTRIEPRNYQTQRRIYRRPYWVYVAGIRDDSFAANVKGGLEATWLDGTQETVGF